ncbi:MAG: DUF885 domain-containing protein [Steroidobacteraceae bacterium]
MRLLLVAGVLLLAGCATPGAPGVELERLVESYFDEDLALNPTTATDLGDHRFDDRLELTASPEYAAASLALERRYRAAVAAIDPQALDEFSRLTREMFLYGRDSAIDRHRFPGRLLPLDQFNGGMPAQLAFQGAGTGSQPFETVADYDRWLVRAAQFPRWVDTAIAAMREGMAQGVVHPRVVMAKVVPQLDSLVAFEAEASVFHGPVELIPEHWPVADRVRLRVAFGILIEETLNPAYAKLRDFIRDEYLPACRDSVGWSALPGGADWYASEVRRHTTTRLAPAEIHAIGLAEVARIRAGMEGVMREVGFQGTLAEFFRYVQEEPAFYFDRPAELLAGYLRLKKRIDAELPRLFSVLPTADYEVREVEAFRAASAAGGSYQGPSADGARPGIFYVNTYNLRAQPIYAMETLSLHEAAPGHHFQVSIQQALTGLPRFRRFEGNVAYGEGWALYAESLGRELGLFTDPMQWYGRLSDEMLRAMRLVVDTGLHAQGWSRERAIRYIRDNSSLADTEIEAEVERYIVWPGQALGYKIGDLRIQAMRRKAEAALGSRFDVRGFHAAMLMDGALPLGVLEAKIDRWIESRR